MKRWFVLLFLAAFFSSLAAAQSQPQPQRDVITSSANGKYEAEADVAVIAFKISVRDSERNKAYERASHGAEQIREALRKHGIDPHEATIGSFHIEPMFSYSKPDKRKLIAYQITADITIRLKDFSKVGELADEFSNFDVTSSESTTYELSDPKAARLMAIENAFQQARAEAEVVAIASRRKLGPMIHAAIDEDKFATGSPKVFRNSMGVVGGVVNYEAPMEEFTPSRITVVAHVSAEFLLQ